MQVGNYVLFLPVRLLVLYGITHPSDQHLLDCTAANDKADINFIDLNAFYEGKSFRQQRPDGFLESQEQACFFV